MRHCEARGNVVFGASGSNFFGTAKDYGDTTAYTLTIGPGITIHGGSGTIGESGYYYRNAMILNQGEIVADGSGGTITINPNGFDNKGTLGASSSGTLNLACVFTSSGTFRNTGGTVEITGGLDNTGSTQTLNSTTGSVTLLGGAIKGGTIAESGSGKLIFTSSGGTLDGVTVAGDLDLATNNAYVYIRNDLTLNDGTIYLGDTANTTSGLIYFWNNEALRGTGNVVFGASGSNFFGTAKDYGNTTAYTLTIGPGITIHGGSGTIGEASYYYHNAMILNQGEIVADGSAGTITINPNGFDNKGTLGASSSGTLNLACVFTSSGTFRNTGGTIEITGALDNTGSTQTLNSTTGSVTLLGGAIQGGTIAESGSGKLLFTSSGGTLDGVTVAGDLDLATNSAYVYIRNDLTLNDGTIYLGDTANTTSSQIYFWKNETLRGTGNVVFGASGNNFFGTAKDYGDATAYTLTIGSGITIHGVNGTIGESGYYYRNAMIVNQGAIIADTSGGTITISSTSFENDGTLGAANSGTIAISSANFENDGTSNASNNGILTIGSSSWQSNGTISATDAVINFNGSGTNSGSLSLTRSTLNLNGTVAFTSSAVINTADGTVNIYGTLDNSGGVFTFNASTGSWYLLGGTVKGGTLKEADGERLIFTTSGGTLDGVTAANDLDFATNSGTYVHVINGLTLDNATVYLGNAAGTTCGCIYFDHTEHLGGSGEVVFGAHGNNSLGTYDTTYSSSVDTYLTIDSGITIRGSSGTVGNAGWYAAGIINYGTILADESGTGESGYDFDAKYSGNSWTNSTAAAIDTSSVGDIASETVYQTYRVTSSAVTYTLDGLTAGASYTVRLLFAEPEYNSAGSRKLSVAINNTTKLTNFDIYAAAGAMNKAIAQSFTVTADSSGKIIISVQAGSAGYALINGIQLLSGSTTVKAIDCGLMPGGAITISAASFTNEGAITANSSDETLTISSASWTNAGTITATDSKLRLSGAWENNSTITVTDSTATLGGTFTTEGIGSFINSGSTVNLAGVLDNEGATFTLNATTGSWNLTGGTIVDGTYKAEGGAELIFTTSGGTLNGVTAANDLDFATNSGAYVHVINGLTLNDATVYLGNAAGTTCGCIYFDNTEHLGGAGKVVFGPNGGNFLGTYDTTYSSSIDTYLTIDSDITIRGTSGTIGDAGWYAAGIINYGAILADESGTGESGYDCDTNYSGSSWTGGTSAAIGTSGVGNTTSETVYQTYRLTSDTVTYALTGLTAGASYTVQLLFAEPEYNSSGSRKFNVAINNTTKLTNFDIYAAAGAMNTAVVKSFAVKANSSGQIIISVQCGSVGYALINGIELLSGSTVIKAIDCGLSAGGSFTISSQSFTNEGAIVTGSHETLTIISTSWTNNVAIMATNSTLNLSGTWKNAGTISVSDSTVNLGGKFTTAGIGSFINSGSIVNLTGTLNNSGATFVLNAATGSWNLLGGAISGGTYRATDGVELVFTSSGGTLDAVTAVSNLDLATNSGAYVFVHNGLTLDDVTIYLGNTSGTTHGSIYFTNTETLGGTGMVLFGASGGNFLGTYDSSNSGVIDTYLTIDSDVTIRGTSGAIGDAYCGAAIINHGTIIAEISGGVIHVNPNSFENDGSLEAIAGTLAISGSVRIDGTSRFSTNKGGTITINGYLLGDVADSSLFTPAGTLILNGSGTESEPQSLEVMSNDLGYTVKGFSNSNFPYGDLTISQGTYVLLVNQYDNAPGHAGEPEALYIDTLTVGANSTFKTNGYNVYVRVLHNYGTIIGDVRPDNVPPSSNVDALPATETSPSFAVSWSGVDDAAGSGVASYDIWYSVDGSAFTLWLDNTTATSATFTGEEGHTYAFYSLATDRNGNQESVGNDPDTYTTISSTGSCIAGYVYIDSDKDGVFDFGETPLANAVLYLTDGSGDRLTSTGGSFISAVTDGNGHYAFTGLSAGVYGVMEDQPLGYSDGLDTVGTAGGAIAANDLIDAITLNANTAAIGYNFGESNDAPPTVTLTMAALTNSSTPSGFVTAADSTFGVSDGTTVYIDIDTNNDGDFNDAADVFGQAVGTISAGHCNFILPTSLADGDYGLRARVKNAVSIEGDSRTVTITVDTTAPISEVDPLPAIETSTMFTVNWSGTDVTSGIASYDVYVSMDGGAYAIWQDNTTATFATFTGENGRTYYFYSVAADNAGNQESAPNSPDAWTKVERAEPCRLSGYVFMDADKDATFDSSESGISGATIALYVWLDGNYSLTTTTNTDSQGYYAFANLDAGTYRIVEIQPSGYDSVAAIVGSAGGNIVSSDVIANIVLPSGTSAVNYEFADVENVAPEVTLTIPASSSSATPSGSVTVTDLGSGVANGTIADIDVDLNNDGDFADSQEAGYGTATITDGHGDFTLRTLADGTYRVQARTRDAVGNEGTSAVSTITINSAVTGASIKLVSNQENGSVVGQSVTFTVTITSASDTTPTGTVTFKDGSKTLGTATLDANGTASISCPLTKAGSHKILAVYGGDTKTPVGRSTILQTVCADATRIVLTAATSGDSLMLTAALSVLSPGSGSLASQPIVFTAGGKKLGTATTNASGLASLTVSASAFAGQTITATYSKGGKNYAGSTASLTFGKSLVATSVALASNSSIVSASQSVIFTVAVGAANGIVPSGTVTFTDGTATLGAATLASDGTTSFTTPSLTIGSHTIVASYGGNSTYAASTMTMKETVCAATTSTVLIASAAPSVIGQAVTFTVIVSADNGATPSGSVTVKDGSKTLATVTLNADGTGTFTTSFGKVGNHKITAVYAGTSSFAASNNLLIESVAKAATTVSVVSSDTTAEFGQSVTYTVTVGAASPGSGAPTGKVILMDGSKKVATARLGADGTATFTISTLTAGSHTLTVSYAGSKNYTAGSGSVVETVSQSATTTTLTTSAASIAAGKTVTIKATVSAVLSGAGAPTGTVTFYDGTTSLGTQPLKKGIATLKISTLLAGSHAITAVYSGDANLTGSTSAAITQTITPQHELLAGSSVAATTAATLTLSQLQPIIQEAERRLTAATGIDVAAALAGVSFQIVNLSGNQLGKATTGVIGIDDDAAGCGWFVDETPSDDAEFTSISGSDSLTALEGTAAASRVDLLTTVMHEMGHLLGYGDTVSDDLMNGTLSPSIRRAEAVDELFATLS